MINLPILIPASQAKADGHSLMPLSWRAEELLWGSERNGTPAPPLLLVDQTFIVDGHDVRKEEYDIKTGKWRQRSVPFAERSEQIKNEPKHANGKPGLPLREVTPCEYSHLEMSKRLGRLKTDLLTALNSLQTACKKRKAVDIKKAAVAVISAGYAASAPNRRNEFAERLKRLDPESPATQRDQEVSEQFDRTEKRLSDRLNISKWLEHLSDWHLQIIATSYIAEVLSPGRVIFWVSATMPPQISAGIFFPDLKAAIAAAVVLDDELRQCLKCGKIFSASRYDGVCCSLQCSNALRQFRHSSKARKNA